NMDIQREALIMAIVGKIKDAPAGTTLTIAEITNYDPNQHMAPLDQGEIFSAVMGKCEQLGIEIERVPDERGGLALYYKFTKK
ncbi:hypothetical protein IKQ65_03630, partial [Candidatus Saccharibacteria bacterium]|nr:hypothetical protein [Candidatus Saccharibacteria bacterium]